MFMKWMALKGLARDLHNIHMYTFLYYFPHPNPHPLYEGKEQQSILTSLAIDDSIINKLFIIYNKCEVLPLYVKTSPNLNFKQTKKC